MKPGQALTFIIYRADGTVDNIPLTLRLDTQMELDYVRHGGIMPYVLSELTKDPSAHAA